MKFKGRRELYCFYDHYFNEKLRPHIKFLTYGRDDRIPHARYKLKKDLRNISQANGFRCRFLDLKKFNSRRGIWLSDDISWRVHKAIKFARLINW